MNEIELLSEIRSQQKVYGKDVIGYGAIACLVATEALRPSGNLYHSAVAGLVGIVSFAKLIAYNECVTVGDKLQQQYVQEMSEPL